MRITPAAQAHLASQLAQGQYMIIHIQAGGCQGFLETFELTDHITDGDHIIQQHVVLDDVSMQLLANAELDHVQSLGHTGFQLRVPEAVSVCGCGKSFHI